ncbi:MAG TPA: hypothetical protein VHO23_01015 [Candidatus Paceibacterota bacterium]|nr:hypothetical protein [Candidatus Paceibacterota bacterium]
MDVEEEMRYWERTLDMPRSAFRKPYIKLSKRSGLSYKQRFAHGTCNVLFENRDTSEYVLMCLEEIRSRFAADSMM